MIICGNIQQGSNANHIRSLLFTWQKSMFTKAWLETVVGVVSGAKHALIRAQSVWTFLLFHICIPIIAPLAVHSGGSLAQLKLEAHSEVK